MREMFNLRPLFRSPVLKNAMKGSVARLLCHAFITAAARLGAPATTLRGGGVEDMFFCRHNYAPSVSFMVPFLLSEGFIIVSAGQDGDNP